MSSKRRGGKTRRAAKMNTHQGLAPRYRGVHRGQDQGREKSMGPHRARLRRLYNGDAYGSIMYQNENLSVRVSGRLHERRHRGPRVVDPPRPRRPALREKRRPAPSFARSPRATWVCGDPGMQFDTTIHKWAHCKGTERQNSTNPWLRVFSSSITPPCNPRLLNLLKYKKPDGSFDVDRFKARPSASSSRPGDPRR